MRCLFEVVGAGNSVARFPKRGAPNGIMEEVPFFWASGVDVDYQDQMIKVKVFRPKNVTTLMGLAEKGNRLTIRFRKMKFDDRFDKCTVITVNDEDIQPYRPAPATVSPAPAVAAAA